MTHCTLLRSPVAEALAVSLINVHGLVAVPRPPCVMVNVAHHLCLYLHHTHTQPLLMRLLKPDLVVGLDDVGWLIL